MLTPKKTRVLVSHRTDAAVSAHATLDVVHLSMGARMIGALSWLGLCWLAALLFVFVPVMHFFLVPMAVLGGIGAFFYRIRLQEYRSAAMLQCPVCKAEIVLKKGAFNWPLRETCNTCRTAFNITPDESFGHV